MGSVLEPEATWAFWDRHTIWTFSGLPIRGVIRFFQKQWKTTSCHAPGPPGTVAPRASNRISVSAAAPENGPCWIDFAERTSKSSVPLTNGTGSTCGEAPTMTCLVAARNAVFSTSVRTGKLKRVAKIVLKPARAPLRDANHDKAKKLCMYVMI